jgi:hypothetical protein
MRNKYYRKLLRGHKILRMQNRRIVREEKESILNKYVTPLVMALLVILIAALILDIKDEISDAKSEIEKDFRNYEKRVTELEGLKNEMGYVKKRLETLEDIFKYKLILLKGHPVISYPASDLDSEDKVLVELTIDILSEQFRWKCNELTVLHGAKPIQLGEAVIKGYTIERDLYNIKKIICIGTASSEGTVEIQEGLAENRAQELINIVKGNIANPSIPIVGMNFGKHMEKGANRPCTKRTINQRRIIILKIIQQNVPDSDLEASLKRVLEEKAKSTRFIFPIDIRKYSKYKKPMLIYGRNLDKPIKNPGK